MGTLITLTRLAVVVIVGAVGYNYLFNSGTKRPIPSVEGYVHPHFQEVADLFRQQVESGMEPGAAFSVYHQGELVVDLRGGWADREAERAWSPDTLTMVYSVSKGVAAILAAKMVDRGWLDYNKPVSHYWPEFQKDNITVGMLLSHQAGLVHLDTPLRLQQLVEDREAVERAITSQQPAWPPGTAAGYHSITFGLYVDTLLQKAHPQKKNISQIFEEEIGKPFGIEFHFGLPRQLHYRMARMEKLGGLWTFIKIMYNSRYRAMLLPFILNSDSMFAKSGRVFGTMDFEVYNNPDVQAFSLSSMLGFTSARNLAKLYGILANGGTYKGKQLLKAETVAKLQTLVIEGVDQVLGIFVKRTYGLFLDMPVEGIVGHNGFGGSIGFMDRKRQMGVGYTTNFNSLYPSGDPRLSSLEEATRRLVDSFKAK